MKGISEWIRRSWRAMLTAVFVFSVFTVPASKGALSKFFGVHATGSHGNQNGNGYNDDSGGRSSYGSPHSEPTASPVNPGDSCSTGRRHSGAHHGHFGHRHYRPNGR